MALLNLPNWITLFRFVLVPVCCGFALFYTHDQAWMRWAALAGFVAAALSDWLDGYLARRLAQRTRLGAILDPIADKLLVNGMVIVLAFNHQFEHPVPMTLLALLLIRDAIILGGAGWIHFRRTPIHPKPRLLGKATTLVNCVCIPVVLAELPIAPDLFWLMGICTVLSAADYLIFGLQDHPLSTVPRE